MSKFLVEPTASAWIGNTCAGCNTHKHPDGFVNTNLDVMGRGRVYFCAGCVREMARGFGCYDPSQVTAVREREAELEELLRVRDAQLVELRENMSVPLAEVIDLVREREKRRPVEVPA